MLQISILVCYFAIFKSLIFSSYNKIVHFFGNKKQNKFRKSEFVFWIPIIVENYNGPKYEVKQVKSMGYCKKTLCRYHRVVISMSYLSSEYPKFESQWWRKLPTSHCYLQAHKVLWDFKFYWFSFSLKSRCHLP